MYVLDWARLGRLSALLLGLFSAGLVQAQQGMQEIVNTAPLSLVEAEKLALSNDPLVSRFTALSSSLQDQAIADAQLPDPTLQFGLQNLPLDTLSRTQDDMTQIELGVQQSFPAGDTLKHRSEKTAALGSAEQARAREEARKVLREVRSSWLEVYYQTQAAKLVRQTQKLFSEVVDVTQSQYGAGFVTQQDVLSADLELSLLKDRETSIEAEREVAQAALGKWIGSHEFKRPLPQEWPVLKAIPARAEIEAHLIDHPLMQAEEALVHASQSEVKVAREQYKPSWGVGVSYGQREDRADMLSAMVTMDVPLFTDKRQDRRLAASQQQAYAAHYARADRRRELLHMLETEYAAWERLNERLLRYEKELVPQAGQNSEVALATYQSGVTDFPTLMRARITALETQLQLLRLRVDHAKAQVNLLYLADENP